MRTALLLVFAALALLIGLSTASIAQSSGSSNDPSDGATWELPKSGSEDLLGGAASCGGMVTVSNDKGSEATVAIVVYDRHGDETPRRRVLPGEAKNMQFKQGESVFVESTQNVPSSGKVVTKFA